MLRLAPLRLLILVRVPNAFPSFLRLGFLPGKALVLMDTQFHPVPAVHANVNGSAAKHVCSSTAEFYEKPCRGTEQSFIHGALQNNVQLYA